MKYKDPSGNGPQYAGDDIVQQNQIDEAYLRGKSDSSVKNQPLLKYGSRGDSVVKVQSILDELGYDLGSSGVDGAYGYYTEKAMKSYQTANGLQSDGIVGPKTWGSFNSFNIYVNKKAAEARNSSKSSNACDDLGGGVVSGNGAYSPDEPGEAYIKSYDPSKINPLLYMSSRDGNLPHSLQEIIIQYSYEYTKANNTDDKKRALTELEYYRGLGNNPATRKYY